MRIPSGLHFDDGIHQAGVNAILPAKIVDVRLEIGERLPAPFNDAARPGHASTRCGRVQFRVFGVDEDDAPAFLDVSNRRRGERWGGKANDRQERQRHGDSKTRGHSNCLVMYPRSPTSFCSQHHSSPHDLWKRPLYPRSDFSLYDAATAQKVWLAEKLFSHVRLRPAISSGYTNGWLQAMA